VDLNETILEVVALTRREAERHGIALQTRLARDLPPVWGDRIQLQQVILNLLTNAIDALRGSDEGPRELLVSSGRDDAQGVLVSVRDSGAGLDPEGLESLFEPFHTTKPDGIGMGLAISRSIVEAHGGRLWATPNAPRGAVFQFTLPLGDGDASSPQHPPFRRTAGDAP
jgi:signal transduction histidine kinase